MKSKKLISFFLLMVLSLQILPLQKVIASFVSNPLAEEIPHSMNPGKEKFGPDEVYPSFLSFMGEGSLMPFQSAALTNFHFEESLIQRHADDILSPPPNAGLSLL